MIKKISRKKNVKKNKKLTVKNNKNKGNIKSLNFPYYHKFKTENEILKDFQKLKIFSPKLINKYRGKYRINKFRGKIIIFLEDYDKNRDLYQITDYFSQECRVKCSFESPKQTQKTGNILEQFKKIKTKMHNNLGNNFNFNEVDDYFYKNKIKECSNFHNTVVVSLLKFLKVRKYLDFSAGWGDRLVGSIASNYCQEYLGVDPSKCLQDKYKKIINTLCPKNKKIIKNFRVINKGFEDADLPKNYFDLAFSSPPFFKLEIYEKEKGQSVSKFNTVEVWKKGFLYPLIDKSTQSLKNYGYFAIYISDYGDVKYTRDMFQYIKNNRNELKYLGDIHWMDKKNPNNIKKINIWQKQISLDKKYITYSKIIKESKDGKLPGKYRPWRFTSGNGTDNPKNYVFNTETKKWVFLKNL